MAADFERIERSRWDLDSRSPKYAAVSFLGVFDVWPVFIFVIIVLHVQASGVAHLQGPQSLWIPGLCTGGGAFGLPCRPRIENIALGAKAEAVAD